VTEAIEETAVEGHREGRQRAVKETDSHGGDGEL
jgi:hypothetical protein